MTYVSQKILELQDALGKHGLILVSHFIDQYGARWCFTIKSPCLPHPRKYFFSDIIVSGLGTLYFVQSIRRRVDQDIWDSKQMKISNSYANHIIDTVESALELIAEPTSTQIRRHTLKWKL